MRRVAIIGAGVAGLRLGGLLRERGLEVELFDKARGPAGRISTRRLDWGRFDHGAQYFTARDPRFVAQVERWVARGVAAPWPARFALLDRGEVRREDTAPVRYVGVPSMSAIAREMAEGLSVRTGVRIASVRPSAHGWVVVADDGFAFEGYDWVVSAVPAPQAPPFLEASAELSLLARRVKFLACHAAMVRYAEPLEVDFDAAFVRDSAVGWVAREASKPGREPSNGWLLHSTPAWSEAHLELPAEQVLEELEQAFARAIPPGPAGLAKRAGGAVHRWLFARVETPLVGPRCWDPSLGLGVCGDWTQGDRVEDAFLSAERLAEAMIPSLEIGVRR
ncbi:MAG: NAD(P)-binding protein [Myxococcota bacterium]